MRAPFVALIAASLTLALAAPAHAADDWFWSAARAELAIEDEYGMYPVSCNGTGRYIRGRGGRRLYRRFGCVGFWDDGSHIVLLRVLGEDTYYSTVTR